MFKHTALAALAFAILSTGVASAQSTNPAVGPGNPTDVMSVLPRGSTVMYMNLGVPPAYANQAQTDRSRVKATRLEWDRAKQAALLINSNHCADAYELAVVAQDERLANSVKNVCGAERRP